MDPEAKKRLFVAACGALVTGAGVLAPAELRAQDMGPPSSQELPPPPSPAPAPGGAGQVFLPTDFARFAPRNAHDMLRQVPGFSIRESQEQRGLGQATGNVLFNGERPSSKSDDLVTQLGRIPAGDVIRIEIVDGAKLDIPGLSGQVANIVYRADAMSGQFAWRPEFRAYYTDPLFTRGEVSVSGRKGAVEYTVGLSNNDAGRSGAGGPTTIFDAAGLVTELRDDVWTSRDDRPKLSGRFTVDGPGSSVGHLNAHYQRTWYDYAETGFRDVVNGVDRVRTATEDEETYNYEIGGDFEFALVGGRLKLIGLNRFDHKPYRETVIVAPVDGSPRSGDSYAQTGDFSEKIARAEYTWKGGGADWQLSAEAAFNALENAAFTGVFDPVAARFVETPFAAGTGQVTEDRYEGLLSYSRPLSPELTMQVVAGGERSTIEQTGVLGAKRTFLRPKGSLTLAWTPSSDFDISAKLQRRVLQLSFYDFLGRVFLNDSNENAGNAALVPQQDWTVEIEANKKLGAWGSTKVRLISRFVEDYVDIIPIGTSGESTGNIAKARASAIDWTSTIQFDPIGWTGAKLDTRVLLQHSSLKDPLTGETRQYSGFTDTLLRGDLRHDIPGTDWAWGGYLEYTHYQPRFRLNEIGNQFEGPVWGAFFIENKDVFGLTLRAQVGNLPGARSRWDRVVYAGRRNVSPISFVEDRNRRIGPIYSLEVRGGF